MDCRTFSNKLMNDDKAVDLMAYLYSRWQDEKEYEDIAGYTIPLSKTYPNISKAHKRPFGFSFDCDDGTLRVEIRSKGRKLAISTRRVA